MTYTIKADESPSYKLNKDLMQVVALFEQQAADIIADGNNAQLEYGSVVLKVFFSAETVTVALLYEPKQLNLFEKTMHISSGRKRIASRMAAVFKAFEVPDAVKYLLNRLHDTERYSGTLEHDNEELSKALDEIMNLRWYQRTRKRIMHILEH